MDLWIRALRTVGLAYSYPKSAGSMPHFAGHPQTSGKVKVNYESMTGTENRLG
jgi:hypothetical protein